MQPSGLGRFPRKWQESAATPPRREDRSSGLRHGSFQSAPPWPGDKLARREEPHVNPKRLERSQAAKQITPVPGGRDAALHVRQGCLTLRRGGGLPCRPYSRAFRHRGAPKRRFGAKTDQPGGKDLAQNRAAWNYSGARKLPCHFRAARMPPSTSGRGA